MKRGCLSGRCVSDARTLTSNALIIAKRMLLRLDIGVENETKDQVAFAKRHLEVAKNERLTGKRCK